MNYDSVTCIDFIIRRACCTFKIEKQSVTFLTTRGSKSWFRLRLKWRRVLPTLETSIGDHCIGFVFKTSKTRTTESVATERRSSIDVFSSWRQMIFHELLVCRHDVLAVCAWRIFLGFETVFDTGFTLGIIVIRLKLWKPSSCESTMDFRRLTRPEPEASSNHYSRQHRLLLNYLRRLRRRRPATRRSVFSGLRYRYRRQCACMRPDNGLNF